jgi:hypothetical protein
MHSVESPRRVIDRSAPPSQVDRVVIVAPGPSATEADLVAIGSAPGTDAIALAGAFLMPSYPALDARVHIIAASHPPITTEQWTAWFSTLMNSVGRAEVLVPECDRSLVEQSMHASDTRINNYGTVSRAIHQRLPGAIRRRPRFSLGGQSVATTALSLALARGYREIALYGVDHDWILNVGKTRHAYDEADNPLVQLGYSEWSSEARFDDECRSYVKLWADYRALGEQAERAGQRIVNVSRTSLLDLFPRLSLEDFLGQNSRFGSLVEAVR